MNRCVTAAAVALGLSVGSAGAALAAPPAPLPFSWTGFYIGAHVGGGWTDSDRGVSYLPSAAAFGAAPFSFSADGNGWIGGVQAGFNWQTGPWVFGVEGDISYTSLDNSGTVAPLLVLPGRVPAAGSTHTSSADMNWFGTLRLRGGVAFEQFVFYVTGGLAFADYDFTTRTTFIPGGAFDYLGSASDTKTGWTLGAGLEWALAPRWSLKAEYLYYDVGDTTVVASPLAANPPFQVATSFDEIGHIARVGVNYRFGGY